MFTTKPITLYELLSLVISAGGFLSVIITLYFLIQQTRYSAILLKETLFSPLDNKQFELDKIFIDYPEYRKYFYNGVTLGSNVSDKNTQITAIAEYILDYFAEIIHQKKVYRNVIDIDYWMEYMEDYFAKSPIYVQF